MKMWLMASLAALVASGAAVTALAQPAPPPPPMRHEMPPPPPGRPLPPGVMHPEPHPPMGPGVAPPPPAGGYVAPPVTAYQERLERLDAERRRQRAEARRDQKAWEAARDNRVWEHRRQLEQVWGPAFLARPECKAELELHADRVARLNRIIDIAEEQHAAVLAERARRILSREIARDARAMADLRARLAIPAPPWSPQ